MKKRDAEFQKRLLETFYGEAAEHLKALASGLLLVERLDVDAQDCAAAVEEIFREVHSLKGAARSVNLREVETTCHALESVLLLMKKGELQPYPALFDVLHRTRRTLELLIAGEPVDSDAVIDELEEAARPSGGTAAPPPPWKPPAPGDETPPQQAQEKPESAARSAAETLRIASSRLDSIFRQIEELGFFKLAMQTQAESIGGLLSLAKECRLDYLRLMKALRELSPGQRSPLMEQVESAGTRIKILEAMLQSAQRGAEGERRSFASAVNRLLDDVQRAFMLPLSTAFDAVAAMVREMARAEGKEIEFSLRGGAAVEVDRRILEGIRDPILHIIRNCVDHGIEKPGERAAGGKPPKGSIWASLSQVGGNTLEIRIGDDGRGLDTEAARRAAVERGLMKKSDVEKLEESEIPHLLFQSGFSTASIVTNISGRGLGLAIVRESVEKLGGAVSISSRAAEGTVVTMRLPVLLSRTRGLLVMCRAQLFVIPTSSVRKTLRLGPGEIRTVENRKSFLLDGRPTAYVPLWSVLELSPPGEHDDGPVPVVVVASSDSLCGFAVDAVIDEAEVLFKSLGKQLRRVRNVAGAAVLGSNRLALVLNPHDLVKSATGYAAEAPHPVEAQERRKGRRVLLVEDSVTSRMLLKNILEAAGYVVSAAVDGIDAFTALKSATFDVVVSDIDMPRMNGFELTARIRSDRSLAALPVILVTALSSREDREKGIDAGANAFMVKSSFDQSDLLEIIERLT